MKKKYVYIGIGLLIVVAALYIFVFRNSDEEIKYRTDKVSKGDIVVQVRATGTVNPVKTVQVGSQVSGIIEKIYVDFNSEVRKGQLIAQIDSTSLYASVKQSEANVERNQAQVNDAKRTLARTTELFNKNLVSQADLDAATTNFESSAAQLKQTKAALDQSKVNLKYAIIRAPIDGVVISRDVDVGQTVASSFQTPKLFSIANDLKKMQVEASVDEADIGNVKVGQEVTFTVDAYQNQEFKGTVSQIRLSPQNVQNVVTYIVIIDVPNPDLKLMPGMTATVSILVDERKDVLRIPALALRFQPPQDVLDNFQKQREEAFKNREEKNGDSTHRPTGDSARFRRFSAGMPEGMKKPDIQKFRKMVQFIWILQGNNELKPIRVRTGISDNRYVELVSGEIKDSADVVIGMDINNGSSQAQQTNPFAPRMSGGSGQRGRDH
jgi:HlyD family secretion protein